VDVYQEDDIYYWDVAAGLALVRAAGGHYRMEPGRSQWQFRVLATNGSVMGQILHA
jgi:myo-inositol-1(or 4)-monophosphatase